MRVVPDCRDMQDNERVWPDCRDVRDNATALRIALSKIEHDDRAWSCGVLVYLQDHLCTTHDAQSIQWMLPHGEAALQRFCSPTPHTTNENGAEPHQAELARLCRTCSCAAQRCTALVCQACGPRAHDVEGLYLVPMGAACKETP